MLGERDMRWVLRDICMWLGVGWENSHMIGWESSHDTDSYINIYHAGYLCMTVLVTGIWGESYVYDCSPISSYVYYYINTYNKGYLCMTVHHVQIWGELWRTSGDDSTLEIRDMRWVLRGICRWLQIRGIRWILRAIWRWLHIRDKGYEVNLKGYL